MPLLLYWIAYYSITLYKLIFIFKKEVVRFNIMTSLIKLRNNHFIKVINNKNNSSATVLIRNKVNLLRNNNNNVNL